MDYEEIEKWEFLYSKMKNEGFHYCFKHYSDFKEIEDVELHKLRLTYIDIADKLENYIIDKYNETKEF